MNWERISETESQASGLRYRYVVKTFSNPNLWNARQYWNSQMLKSTWLPDEDQARGQCQKWEDVHKIVEQISTTGTVSTTPED